MVLSRYDEGFEPPTHFPELFSLSSFFLWNVLISSNSKYLQKITDFLELLPNSKYLSKFI